MAEKTVPLTLIGVTLVFKETGDTDDSGFATRLLRVDNDTSNLFSNSPIIKNMCERCDVGELIAEPSLIQNEFGGFQHICSNCGSVIDLDRPYPYVSIETADNQKFTTLKVLPGS